MSDKSKKYYQKNQDDIIAKTYERKKKKLKTDSFFKLRNNISSLIRVSMSKCGYSKTSNTHQILGCNYVDFLKHLNSNPYGYKYGDKCLDLDHVIPISKAVDEKGIIALNHFTNFQLLPSDYNRHIKRDNDWNQNHFKKWITQDI